MKTWQRAGLGALLTTAVPALWSFSAHDEPGPWLLLAAWQADVFLLNCALTYLALFALRALLSGQARRTLFELITLSFALGVSLVILELPAYLGFNYARLLRLPEAAALTRLRAWENPNNIADRDLMYRHRPHQQFKGNVAGDLVSMFGIANQPLHPVDVRYDHNGFRNDKDLKQADIVVIGDSYVEGGLVASADTLPAQLGKRLGLSAANLGVFGYGPQQERIVLERYGLPLKPKLIVWVFFDGNDLKDAARYADYKQASQTFMPSKTRFLDRSLVSNVLRRVATLSDGLRKQDSANALRHSCTYQRAKEAGDRTLYFAYDANEREFYGQLEVAQAEILAARAATQAAGARFVLVHATVAHRLIGDLCTSNADSVLREWREVDDLPQRMQQFAQAHGLEFVDLGPAFRTAIERGVFPFFADDGHWDAQGHALAAEVIANAM